MPLCRCSWLHQATNWLAQDRAACRLAKPDAGNCGRYFAVRNNASTNALSSLTRGREYDGLMPNQCSMASTVVASSLRRKLLLVVGRLRQTGGHDEQTSRGHRGLRVVTLIKSAAGHLHDARILISQVDLLFVFNRATGRRGWWARGGLLTGALLSLGSRGELLLILRVLERLIGQHGKPEAVRIDNVLRTEASDFSSDKHPACAAGGIAR